MRGSAILRTFEARDRRMRGDAGRPMTAEPGSMAAPQCGQNRSVAALAAPQLEQKARPVLAGAAVDGRSAAGGAAAVRCQSSGVRQRSHQMSMPRLGKWQAGQRTGRPRAFPLESIFSMSG